MGKHENKITGTITQTQITGTTTESQSYSTNYWKLKLLDQLLKTEIIGIITNSAFFLILELFPVTERIADTMKKE